VLFRSQPYAPLHLRPAAANRNLEIVRGTDADAENIAALAQPAQPDENDLDDEPVSTRTDTVTERALCGENATDVDSSATHTTESTESE